MSDEKLKAFWDAIQSDSALQQKLQGVTDPAAIVDIGKEAGFLVSIDEVQKAQAELSNVELSDEDLDNVAGGFHACKTF